MEKKVSIIIRTKNEEKWISSCLKAVFAQTYSNIEVILVDNNSSDRTVDIASGFNVKVIQISEFKPGRALNDGIRASNGSIIVCLSGHCIPVNNIWLEKIISSLEDELVGGVYGRQQPMSFSSDIDKRDLFNLFGFDKKVQIKDSFFHNANSAFRREIWDKYPFDESASNIEDRLWGNIIIKEGLKIIYEPEASVYHWHGVHHDSNPTRAKNIVRIMETLPELSTEDSFISPSKHKISLIIPIKGKSKRYGNKSMLEYIAGSIKNSKYLSEIYVATDDSETANLAQKLGFSVPFLRPLEFSLESVDILDVVSYFVNQLEKNSIFYDAICIMTENYPFRRTGVIDEMLSRFVREGLDTLIAGRVEDRGGFVLNENKLSIIESGFMPRDLKKNKLIIGMIGYACISRPSCIRNQQIFDKKIGVFEITDYLESFEIRKNISDHVLSPSIMPNFNN